MAEPIPCLSRPAQDELAAAAGLSAREVALLHQRFLQLDTAGFSGVLNWEDLVWDGGGKGGGSAAGAKVAASAAVKALVQPVTTMFARARARAAPTPACLLA